MGELDALADAATGGILARAVEPDSGEKDGHTHEANCLNCGCTLVGDFCHCCGQRAHVHRSLGAFGHDLLHGVLHFEGKIWRTLPMLTWRPGELTRRYIAGERANFVSPLALFLFSVFLMFAVINLLGGPIDVSDTSPAEDRAEARTELLAERAEANQAIASLRNELATARTAGEPTRDIEREISERQRELKLAENAYRLAMDAADREEQQDVRERAKNRGGDELTILSKTGWQPLDKAIEKAESNPALLFYKLQSNAYKFSWAIIPLSLPFLWMLFLHRRRYRRDYGAYDHLIFITYSIAFMSLGAIALTLLGSIGVGEAVTGMAISFIPPIHFYRQLRGAYSLSRWSALWRAAALVVISFVVLTCFLILLILLGVLG